ncbi:MAG: hypothetical protein ABEI75_00280, partial [Halobaculum sp.]
MRVEYDPDEPHVFAVDPERNTVTLETTGWEETEPHRETDPLEPAAVRIDRRSHAVTERLVGPPVHAVAIDAESEDRTTVTAGDTVSLDAETVVRLSSTVRVVLRPEGPGRLERRAGETVIAFPEPTAVTVGWASRIKLPDRTVRLPRTLDGLAEYLTLSGAAATATSPDRTWPNARDHPPRLRYGDREVPGTLREGRPETNVELLVPRDGGIRTLCPLAPLAHYLGARVTVETGVEPAVVLDGRTERLGETTRAADRAASRLLRRVFYLDCLARSAGPYGDPLSRVGLLDELRLDADRLYDAPLAERVRAYLDAPFETVADDFPDWHLGVHLDPSFDRARTLPAHLNRLSDVYTPESAALTIPDRIEWSVEHSFARGPAGSTQEEPPVVDPADRARTVGWAAPRVALGAFNSFPEALDNRERHTAADEPLSVVVVNNAMGMFEEHQRVIENYRERVAELPIMEVEAHSMLSPNALAELFESRSDLLHFIGHCDGGKGLRCPNREHLHTTAVDDCGAATFVLNACGSYDQGRELLRRGSVAGVVTLVTAKDRTATRVGIDWSRLMANGWSVERGLDLARRATDSPGNYVIVGDG